MRKHFREIATEQQQRRSREDVIQRLVLHAVRNGDVISTLSLHASEEMMSQKRQQQPAGALQPLLLRGGGLEAVGLRRCD